MLTEKQLLARKNGLGASDTPIHMGYSTFKTPVELYLEKIGVITQEEELTERQYWGNLLESSILARFTEETGFLVTFPETQFHKEYPFIFANLDGWIPSEKSVVEAKNVDARQRYQWDDTLPDGIPMPYLIQIAKQCMITDATRGYCAVLFGGNEYMQFTYERDLELEKLILEADLRFWECVQNKEAPEPINTTDCRLLYAKVNPDNSCEANFKIATSINELRTIKEQLNNIEKQNDKFKTTVMNFMKENEYLLDENGDLLASWKKNKKGNRVFTIKG